MRRTLWGPVHPLIAESLDDLGAVYFDKGDLATAEPVFREALAMRRVLFGDVHEDVAASLNNLALTIQTLRADYPTVIAMQTEVLSIYQKRWSGDHPSVAQALNNLGMTNYRARDFAAAEPLLHQALAMNLRLLGEAHPEVAANRNNLGLLLRDSGDFLGASQQFEAAIASNRATFGSQHPETLNVMINLAATHTQSGDHSQAQAIFRDVLAQQLSTYPSNDVRIATTKGLLGADLIATRHYGEAELLLTGAHAVIAERFGKDHPRTQAMVKRLVALYEATEKKDDAARARALLTE
jgi:tetratricopeptide (TPR) repeat protein